MLADAEDDMTGLWRDTLGCSPSSHHLDMGIFYEMRPLRIPFSRPCLALRTQFDVLTAPQLGLIPGLFLPFLAEMPDFGRTSPFRLAPVEQLFSN
jgi:hypothetical protein